MIIYIIGRMFMIKIYHSLALIMPFLDNPTMFGILTYYFYKFLRFPNYFKIFLIY